MFPSHSIQFKHSRYQASITFKGTQILSKEYCLTNDENPKFELPIPIMLVVLSFFNVFPYHNSHLILHKLAIGKDSVSMVRHN